MDTIVKDVWPEVRSFLEKCASAPDPRMAAITGVTSYQGFAVDPIENLEHGDRLTTNMLTLAAQEGRADLIEAYLKSAPSELVWDEHDPVCANLKKIALAAAAADRFPDVADVITSRLHEYRYPKERYIGQYSDPATDTLVSVMVQAGRCLSRNTVEFFMTSSQLPHGNVHRKLWTGGSSAYVDLRMKDALYEFAEMAAVKYDLPALHWVLQLLHSADEYVREFAKTAPYGARSGISRIKDTSLEKKVAVLEVITNHLLDAVLYMH